MSGLAHSKGEGWTTTQLADYERFRPHMLRSAIDRRLQGYHYNGYLVGAAGFGYIHNQKAIFCGCNYKSRKGTEGPRVCAEDEMEAEAQFRACTQLVGFAVAALPKPDPSSGGEIEGCKIPCDTCRTRHLLQCRDENGYIRFHTIVELMRLSYRGEEVVVEHIARRTIRDILDEFPVSMDETPSRLVTLHGDKVARGPFRSVR